MFDRIAPTYDLLNRLISFRRDVAWRKRFTEHLPAGEALRVLDLATGTGDVLIDVARRSGRVRLGVGLDMSARMLDLAGRKFARARTGPPLTRLRSDACAISAADVSFDAATMAFGIRNVQDVPAALGEIRRVLRRGGRALIMEFSLPRNPIFRAIYLFYFRQVLPRIGGVVSGDRAAYRYLNESVERFPHGRDFCRLMEDAGFTHVEAHPLTFGIATLYIGEKAA